MDSKQQEILKQLEDAVQNFINDFEQALPDATDDLLNELFDFLGTLKRRSNGSIEASVVNLRSIDKFRTTLDKYLASSVYSDSVKEYIKGFKNTTSYINAYFATIVQDFKANDELFKLILQSNIDTTVESLLGSGLKANFKEPIIKLLKQNVAGNTSIKALRESLRQELSLTGQPVRYVKQQASDALMQYTRNYMQALSNDMGINYYLYAGTKINDTRPFCSERVGKYFTKEQVQAWADKEWSGKNKATTSTSIFYLCGGYGCRHSLIPVSKEMYERETK